MALRRSDRERRRRAFLYALGTGSSVGEAAEHAGISRATLYNWRQNSASFAAAWDRAALRAHSALVDRMQSALVERAVEGIDEPVFHAGKLVGTRKRYSDALLLAGLREMTAPPPAAAKRPAGPVVPRIILRPFPHELDETPTPRPIAAPEPATPEPITPEIIPPPPEPAEAPALDWSHLGRHE